MDGAESVQAYILTNEKASRDSGPQEVHKSSRSSRRAGGLRESRSGLSNMMNSALQFILVYPLLQNRNRIGGSSSFLTMELNCVARDGGRFASE